MALRTRICGISMPKSFVLFIIFSILFWPFCFYFVISKMKAPLEDPLERLNEVLKQLEEVNQNNEKLELAIYKKLTEDVEKSHSNSDFVPDVPLMEICKAKLEYELTRRRIQSNIAEMWSYLQNELQLLQNEFETTAPALIVDVNDMLSLGAEHKRALLSDMCHLRQMDGHELWRQKEAFDLANLVQQKLQALQTPANCETAPKLYWTLKQNASFGCAMLSLSYALANSFEQSKMLMLDATHWPHVDANGLKLFEQISNHCRSAKQQKSEPQTVNLPIEISAMIAERLRVLHGNPTAWMMGQFLSYILKPLDKTGILKDKMTKLNWTKPIVGIHVSQCHAADGHCLEQYMNYVEDFFLTLEINGTAVPRHVFIVCDSLEVVEKARAKYANYAVLANSPCNDSLFDMQLLARTDFLICSNSSVLCHLAFNLMQTFHVDASAFLKLLNPINYVANRKEQLFVSLFVHKPTSDAEIELTPEDKILVISNDQKGFSFGLNLRTNDSGWFPSFKVDMAAKVVYRQINQLC